MSDRSFEGQMSGLDFNFISNQENQEIQIKNIKTPDQIPDSMNLNALPDHILRSNVVESLINQNDDLMSRLNVTLRRISTLEASLSDTRAESSLFKEKFENSRDQVLVLREQSKIISERNKNEDEKQVREFQNTQKLKDQIQLLEIRYAELYSSSQEKYLKLSNQLESQENKKSRFVKYRNNIRKALIPLKTEVKQLREKISLQNQTVLDLRSNLLEATSYISQQAKNHKAEIVDITEGYEAEIRLKNEKLSNTSDHNRTLTERVTEMDRLFNQNVHFENELIIARRQFDELQTKNTIEIVELQKALARFRNESKEMALQLNHVSEENTKLAASTSECLTEKSALNEQVETLQALWRDQQFHLEKSNEQKKSLQKLNQELSTAINEYRREIRELKQKNDSLELKLKDESSLYEKKLAATHATFTIQNDKKSETISPELMLKIDKAITDIQTY
jgi:chromosome segregation ATPase